MKLDELAGSIDPARTALLLGAGASVASGAPTGAQLARALAAKVGSKGDGIELPEICGIFENRLGRRALVEELKRRLDHLQPTQGLLALPSFGWRAIYTTNFDQLVERAYRKAARDLRVIRSNFDFSTTAHGEAMTLYKIHGCISQDVSTGHRARLLLTESDYDELAQYRRVLFASLEQTMLTSDTVIVGQSLADRHLRELAKEVARLRAEGAPGRICLLAYEYDEDRAQLFEQRGIRVVEGSLETFLTRLMQVPGKDVLIHGTSTVEPGGLPARLQPTTVDVSHARRLAPDVVRLFNGAPAAYADIEAGLTIPREVERRLDESQKRGVRGYFLVVSGAAGVGKTTLARRLMHRRSQEAFAAWEHKNDFPLDVEAWLEVEAQLRGAGRNGVLFIDDCARQLSSVNRLVDALGALDRPFLRLVVTVNAGQWKTRTKSKYFFSRGTIERLSLLTEPDIKELVGLVDREARIRALVEADFLGLGHLDKVRRLRDRCSADMFVCLKNIFHSDSLDTILLQEFADLPGAARDVYRHVAALQAMGAKVHRQLVMRLLSIDAGGLQSLLAQMEDVVSEYDVRPADGLYGWTTRHDVIAKTVATYKFADQQELRNLIFSLVTNLNPTVHMELETARAIASHEMGIPRLADPKSRADMLRLLIETVPGERTPRRRLVRLYLDQGDLPEADRAITVATRDLGRDNIIDRYRAILALYRAEQTPGLLPEDRRAMLLEAERIARECVADAPGDRFNYRVLADIGAAFVEGWGDFSVIDDAIETMTASEADVADPDFASERRTIETRRRRLGAQPSATGVADVPEDLDALADEED